MVWVVFQFMERRIWLVAFPKLSYFFPICMCKITINIWTLKIEKKAFINKKNEIIMNLIRFFSPANLLFPLL
jgi:hypothetical protein